MPEIAQSALPACRGRNQRVKAHMGNFGFVSLIFTDCIDNFNIKANKVISLFEFKGAKLASVMIFITFSCGSCCWAAFFLLQPLMATMPTNKRAVRKIAVNFFNYVHFLSFLY